MPSSASLPSVLAEAFDVAVDAVSQTRSSLMVAAPYLDVALWRMPFASRVLARSLATDGYRLYLDSGKVVVSYRENPNEVLRDYLHAILHCVFRHPFDGKHPRLDVWDLACDLSVEATAMELVGAGFPSARDGARRKALDRIAKSCPSLTAKALYKALAALLDEGDGVTLPTGSFGELVDLFARDDHRVWTRTDEVPASRMRLDDGVDLMPSDGSGSIKGAGPDGEEEDDPDRSPGVDMPGSPAPSMSSAAVEGDVEDGDALIDIASIEEARATFASMEGVGYADFEHISWQDISALIEMDMEAFSGKIGTDSASLMANLSVANRKPCDYRDFLKRFSALSEEMVVNQDEFDYIAYTYGLSRYKNMPLVEPLEYQETDRVRDFVIAIDTSASCAGGLIKTFVEKTFDVLKNTEGFGRTVNVHVVQCDSDVRSDTKVTDLAEIGEVFDGFSTRGYGGTDFRPVFAYVDDLVRDRELVNLKGLIYFTDGLGTYPEHPPDYETVFVFVDEEHARRTVPPWAMKVVMDEDEIMELS